MHSKKTFSLSLFLAISVFCNSQEVDSLKIKKDSIKLRTLNSVTFVGTKNKGRNNRYQYDLKEIKSLVSVIGESDVLRYISVLPGISQGMEGGMGYFVRGGNSGNNRIEFDQVPVFGTSHIFGLFSVFHPKVVGSVTFNTGKIPAASGDMIASLCSIKSVIPDSVSTNTSLSISPFMAGFGFSTPIIKNKLTIIAAGRVSLLKPEIMILKKIVELEGDTSPETTDLYLKLRYNAGNKHIISFSSYFSNDFFKFSSLSTTDLNWGNSIYQFNWDWKIDSTLNLSTVVYSSSYNSGEQFVFYDENTDVPEDGFSVMSRLNEQAIKSTLKYEEKNYSISGGISVQKQKFKPFSEQIYLIDNDPYTIKNEYNTSIITLFSDANYKIDKFYFSAGIRSSLYNNENQNYWKNNLRLSAGYEITGESGVELCFDQFTQFHHLLEGLPSGWPMDLLVPSNEKFKPESANQIYIGGYFVYKKFLLSGGVYYKSMTNLVSYKSALNFFGTGNTSWYDDVSSGKGNSYGLEMRAERKSEKLNLNMSYTLSKTNRTYNEINEGKSFPFKFDRRHILNASAGMLTRKRGNKEQYLNLTLALTSGHKMTIPVGMYKGITPPYWKAISSLNLKEMLYSYYRVLMSDMNGYSLPVYLRTDIGYSFVKKRRKYTRDLTIGVANVMNRMNPYLVFYENDRWKELCMLPVMPSIKWEINF